MISTASTQVGGRRRDLADPLAPERVTVCPWRIGTIVAAALVLTNAERSIH